MDVTGLRGMHWQQPIGQPANTPARQEQQVEIIQAVQAVNEASLFGQQYELTFDMDRSSRRTLLKLVDRNTREVVRQLPPEYVLRMAREIGKR